MRRGLGDDEQLVTLPPESPDSDNSTPSIRSYINVGPETSVIPVGVLRTSVWEALRDTRTQYLEAWQKARVLERKAYKVLATQVSILIDQNHSPESRESSSVCVRTEDHSRAPNPPIAGGATPGVSTYTPATTTGAKDAEFYRLASEMFTEAGKGKPTTKQLTAAWKIMPADADLEAFQTFLLVPPARGAKSRMERAEHSGILATIVAEFAALWIKGAARRAWFREEQQRKVVPIRQHHIRELIELAHRIIDNPDSSDADRNEAQDILLAYGQPTNGG